MTDYPSKKNSWKRADVQAKWQNMLAIFITVVLLFAVANGILRSFSPAKKLGESSWKQGSSLIVAVNSNPGSILVYRDDPNSLALFTFGRESNFATGDSEVPILKLSEVFSAENISDGLVGAVHLPVGHYLIFKDKPDSTLENFEKYFKNFASVTTPFYILLKYPPEAIVDTNLTRSDLFRLWWGIKSYRLENLVFSDLGHLTSLTVLQNGQQVETLDTQQIVKKVSQYLESRKISEEGFSVSVVNASGVPGAGQLAADLVAAVGGHVTRVEIDSGLAESSLIYASGDSATASYLANILSCDIKTGDEMAPDEIIVTIGVDFAQKYLKGS